MVISPDLIYLYKTKRINQMKKLFVLLLVVTSSLMNAQTKTGTVDSEFILSKMPELTKVQEELKTYNDKLEGDLKVKIESYQAKVKDYTEKQKTLEEPAKKTKQEEIVALEKEINKFQQNGAQLVKIEQNRLLQPLYQKIGAVLEEVSKAEGYTQVFTTTASGLAFVDTKFDLTNSVLNKLGIKVEDKAAPAAPKK